MTKEERKEYNRRHRQTEKYKTYIKANRDVINQRIREWRKSEAGKLWYENYKASEKYKKRVENKRKHKLPKEVLRQQRLEKRKLYRAGIYKVIQKKWRESKMGKKICDNLHYVKKFGITLEQYEEMLAKQNGNCAICGEHQSNFKHRLAVDHNHITKKVRGLLCFRCNTGLGSFKEDITRLQKSINYLQERN